MDNDNLDLKLKLLAGCEIQALGYGGIKPLTLREIVDYGYSNYMSLLNIISLSSSGLLGEIEGLNAEDLPNPFDLLLSLGDEELIEDLTNSLSLFLRAKVELDIENLQAIVTKPNGEVRLVNSENYDEVSKVIKYQNYVVQLEEEEVENQPMDERTRKLKERLAKLKEEREKAKKRSGGETKESDMDLFDIISSLSSKSFALSEIDIFNLTVYQIYGKFQRIDLIDQYELSVKSIMAGAQSTDIKHWSGKIS